MKIVFASDLHGNLQQYESVIAIANRNQSHYIIFGGDLFPKGIPSKTPSKQFSYFKKQILPILLQSQCEIIITFGNADFYCNVQRFKTEFASLSSLHFLESEWFLLKQNSEEYLLLCYSGVPFTRHNLKDFERFDTQRFEDFSERTYLKTNGFTSIPWNYFSNFSSCCKQTDATSPYGESTYGIEFITEKELFQKVVPFYSIDAEMRRLLEKQPNRKKFSCIWCTHGPPYNSIADFCKNIEHVGSKALQQLIKEEKPLLTLHGHIHETVDLNGGLFKQFEKDSQTWIMCTGNDPHKVKVAALVIDTNALGGTNRCLL